jgi:hypothetical protein
LSKGQEVNGRRPKAPLPAGRRCSGRSRCSRLCLAGLHALACAAARADQTDLTLGVASSMVLRGVAVGDDGFTAQAAATHVLSSGWLAGLGAAALHSDARDSWDAQYFWKVGRARPLNADWSAQAAYIRYAFRPAHRRGYGYDELSATLAWRDQLYLSIAGLRSPAAASASAPDRRSVAGDVVLRQPLQGAWAASGGIGYQRTRHTDFAYGYGHAGLGLRMGSGHAELSYLTTSSAAKARFGRAAANRWIGSLTWTF